MIRKLSYRLFVIAMVSALITVPVACGKKGPLEREVSSPESDMIKSGTLEPAVVTTIIRTQ